MKEEINKFLPLYQTSKCLKNIFPLEKLDSLQSSKINCPYSIRQTGCIFARSTVYNFMPLFLPTNIQIRTLKVEKNKIKEYQHFYFPVLTRISNIFRTLLLRLVEKSLTSKHPQLMLRRTESIVEKMLTNWLALAMYDYMKDYAGSSLFVLFKAIKFQVSMNKNIIISDECVCIILPSVI